MSKPRMYGNPGGYTPNSKMDMRHRKKIYERGRVIAERDPYEARERRELKELEAMKQSYEAQSDVRTDKDIEFDEAYKKLQTLMNRGVDNGMS